MTSKYFKPKSLTWWVAVVQIILGAILATEAIHGLTGVVDAIHKLTGNVDAYVLVSAGLGGIGLRGALG